MPRRASRSRSSRCYVTYDLTSGNARPTYGIAPIGTGMPDGPFSGDTWIIYGGCPGINDFDVMEAHGSSAIRSTYGPPDGTNAAPIRRAPVTRVSSRRLSLSVHRNDEENGRLERRDISMMYHYFGARATNLRSHRSPSIASSKTTPTRSTRRPSRFRSSDARVAHRRLQRGGSASHLSTRPRAAGRNDVRWDGTDAAGSPVASGSISTGWRPPTSPRPGKWSSLVEARRDFSSRARVT
jgi:hypothetical protein